MKIPIAILISSVVVGACILIAPIVLYEYKMRECVSFMGRSDVKEVLHAAERASCFQAVN